MMPRPTSKIKSNRQLVQAVADGIRHSARNPSIDKYVPHDKQIPFHICTAPGRQFIGGNRSGKTVGGATELVMYATGKHIYKTLPWRPPLRLRAVTVDLVQGLEKIMLPEIKKWVPVSELVNGSWEDSYDKALRTLNFQNGSFIEFLTYEQQLEKFAGTSRHAIWFDEEPPKAIFTECKLRLTDTEGHWWMTMTPVEGMTWTYEDIYEANDPYVEIFEVDMDDNPHLTEKGKAMALSGLDKDEIEARKHGQYVSLGGMIYPEFKANKGTIVIDSHLPPEGTLLVNSMDHGYTNPTAWLWAYINEKGQIVVYDEWYKDREIVSYHAKRVNEKNYEHSVEAKRSLIPSYNVGDPSIRNTDPLTGTSVRIEYMQNGIPILLGNNDVKAGIDLVKKKLNTSRLFITNNCVNLIREMGKYRWAVWQHTNDKFQKNKKEEPQKKDDHACDALRYLVSSRPEVETSASLTHKPNLSSNATRGYRYDEIITDRDISGPRNNNHDEMLGDDW